jgi:hypothetical protein
MAQKKSKPVGEMAVVHLFEGETAQDCQTVRNTIDGVLSEVSKGSITPTTDNDKLLSLFVISDKIPMMYVRINQAFSSRTGFKLFGSSEIKKTSSVGDVRTLAYSHCGVKCSHV